MPQTKTAGSAESPMDKRVRYDPRHRSRHMPWGIPRVCTRTQVVRPSSGTAPCIPCCYSCQRRPGSNRVPASDHRQALGFQWFRNWDLLGLATNIICSFGAQQLDSLRPGQYWVPRLIRPHLSKSHRPHFRIRHAGFGDQTSQLAHWPLRHPSKTRTHRRRA